MSAVSRRLAVLERYYTRTQNPLYVWRAVALVAPDKPLPPWTRAYLAETARKVCNLGPPDTAPERVSGALGLTARGRNAFAEYRLDRWAKLFATGYLFNQSLGAGQLWRTWGDGGRSLRAESTVYRWIARAKRLGKRHIL